MNIFKKLFSSSSNCSIKKIYFSVPSLGIERASMKYIGNPEDLTEMKLEIINVLYREKDISISIKDIILLD